MTVGQRKSEEVHFFGAKIRPSNDLRNDVIEKELALGLSGDE